MRYTPPMRVIPFLSLMLASLATSFGQPARPKITGIAFMRVYSTDPVAAERFYGGTLGFPERQSAGTLQFVVNRRQWLEVRTTPPPSPTNRMAAVAFTTDNVRQLAAYLRSKGVTDIKGPQAGELAVDDPEGNHVVFVQRGDAGPEQKTAHETAPSPTATSYHIIHIGFIVRDRAREDAFWRGVLGFKPYWYGGKKPGETDWVSMQAPDGTDWLELMLGASSTPSLRESGVLDHFSLGTRSMNTVLAQLQKNGCEGKNCTAIQVGRDGKIQLNLFDPDQTRVEFMEFQPAIEPCCSAFTGPQPSDQVEDRR